VGNRAFTALVMREAARSELSGRPHPRLHPGAAGWSEDGRIVLGPPSLLLSRDEREAVLRHEAVHVLQQRLAPREETAAARERAERLAGLGAAGHVSPRDLLAPAPRLLSAPVSGKPATGFTRLFAGNGTVIGEVAASGVTVRAEQSYEKLGIEAPVDPKSTFGTASMTELQFLACGNRAFPVLQKLAKDMGVAASRIADMNAAIAKASGWRVEQVLVVNEESRLHVADGKPLITISHEDFARSGGETAAHEAAHAVFESHTHDKPGGTLAPDAFSLRFADLFRRLGATKAVPLPKRPFRKAKPSLKATGDDQTAPAGLAMVTDTLWGAAETTKVEGHPWEGVDELFASAYGAFRVDEPLLGELIAHYAKADASVTKLGQELLDLLKAVRDPKALKGLTAPAKADAEAAKTEIAKREGQQSKIKERLGEILDPERLPPKSVTCPK
jgi:hypothetical protein